MKNIQRVQLVEGSREELLPDFSPDFPYIASRVLLDRFPESTIPWHWHGAAELFYVESGTLEYTTPGGKWIFPAGSGGFVNANILHTSRSLSSEKETVQLLHLFDPEFLSGGQGSQIDRKYIRPLTTTGPEIIVLSPEDAKQAKLLSRIHQSFELTETDWGYELALRQQLTEIWLNLLDLSRASIHPRTDQRDSEKKIKDIMLYIHTHYSETICVEQLAMEAHISKRVCYRLFQENLHMSPVAYLTAFRLRKACQKLIETDASITQIAYSCGFGSSSYFGKLFRNRFGCSPAAYRRKWQDCNIKWHR